MGVIKKKYNWVPIILDVSISFVYLFLMYKRYYNVPASIFDDQLQVTIAKNLVHGNWLGAYNVRILAKGITYPIFLVAAHFSHIPLWLVQAGFTYISVGLLCVSIRPLIKNKYMRVVLFLSLVLNPILFDNTQVFIYRDSIAYGLICLVLAWIFGTFSQIILRKNVIGSVKYILLGAVALPAWINLREDSFWIYPFIIISMLIIIVIMIVKMISTKKFSIIILLFLLPILSTVLVNNYISSQNKSHYGRTVVNDYVSKDFETAYGALTRVKTNHWTINVPVNYQMRERLYKSVPAINKLKPYLDDNGHGSQEPFKNYGTAGPTLGKDYQGGWFFWALRGAIQDSGNASNASEFHRYNILIAKQVNTAISNGSLAGIKKNRASLTPTFKKEYIFATLHYLPNFKKVFLYSDIEYLINPTVLTSESYDTMHFLKVGFVTDNGDQYRGKITILASIKNIFVVYTTMGLVFSIFVVFVLMYQVVKKRSKENNIWKLVILFGLMGEIVLRIIMLSYVSISSFESIGYNYLSTIFPLIMLTILITLDTLLDFLNYKRLNSRYK